MSLAIVGLSALCVYWWVDGDAALLALAVFAGGLLVLYLHHVRHIAHVAHWVERPSSMLLPDGVGMWAPVFLKLNRQARDAREHRERLTGALERFRAASQAMPDGVVYLSDKGAIEWLNGRAEQHLGLDPARDLGVPLVGLVRSPALVQYLAAANVQGPLFMQSPRRPEIRLLIQVAPFGDGQKMVISRDITQIERLETMRQDFIANVSHELRTPLTVVGGFLETIQDGLDSLPREDINRYLGMALDQANRMQRLIGDLLTLSALETSAPAPAEDQIELITLVRQVHQEAELLSAGRHAIELQLDPCAVEDVLLGSEKEIHSALANLASNAVRYTPAGGRITIGWRRLAAGGLFWVEDNGPGIEPEHIPRLTERFFRADRGRSRETGGTGLGLAIVKHIVSRHQAELKIDSTLGEGSRFCVCFPAARLTRIR